MVKNISKELDEILDKEFKILNHGFVRVVDYMGNDSSVVQAARVSYGAGTKQLNEDQGLINYLMRNRHDSPFEMCEIKFHVKCPFFIARQWMRHRSGSFNEYSARYSILGKDFYVPKEEDIACQAKGNKQGREIPVPEKHAKHFMAHLREFSRSAYEEYEEFMNVDFNISRELTRSFLTLNYYTEFYWKVNLRNLMHFLKLRSDSHAQHEIRVYALKILDIMKLWVPMVYQAFENYNLEGEFLSKQTKKLLDKKLKGEGISFEESGMSKREWVEFVNRYEL